MRLTEHDLRQINYAYLESLPQGKLVEVTKTLLDDLKDARDRLNQNPQNSSRPPSSREPWLRAKLEEELEEELEDMEEPESNEDETGTDDFKTQLDSADETPEEKPPDKVQTTGKSVKGKSGRKAGKQKGAAG